MNVWSQRLGLSVAAGLAALSATSAVDAADRPPLVAAGHAVTGSGEREPQTMKTGRWEGDYIDVEGHRAKLRLTVTDSGPSVKGDFELILATEDRPEKYQGSVTGSVNGDAIVLRLQTNRGEPLVCTLTLREPAAYAEQAAFGVVAPAPRLKLGGGVLIVWKFRG